MLSPDREPRPDLRDGAGTTGPTRRDVLRAAAVAPLAAVRPWGLLPPGDTVLVVLELRGGNDGLNTVVPFQDDRYHALRPRLALPRRALLPLPDGLNAFPRQLGRLRERFDRGHVAVVQRVGYPRTNLSHFRSQDVWAAADPDDPQPASGWLGRLLADADPPGEDPAATALFAVGTDVAPLALRGARRVPPAVGDLATFRFRAPGPGRGRRRLEALDALNAAPAGDARTEFLQRSFAEARRASERVARLRDRETRAAYPGDTLGRALASVARLITGELGARAYHVTLDGFDTHTRQAQEHPQLLTRLDAALAAFLDDLEAQDRLDRVVVMTTSEFGRRPEESGVGPDAGTDHGAASVLLLAGGRVRGGVHGGQPDLADLDEHGNARHALDFRQVYAAVVEDWLGGDARLALGAPWPKPELFA